MQYDLLAVAIYLQQGVALIKMYFLCLFHVFNIVDDPNNALASKPVLSQCHEEDEKQTFLTLSARKLQRIEDPESCLRKTVLIGNTLKRLRSRDFSSTRDFRLVERGTKEKAAGCFSSTLPRKRARLHVTDILNSNTERDLKSDYDDIQQLLTRQDKTSTMEITYLQPNSVSNCAMTSCRSQKNATFVSSSVDEAKRNCDPIIFNVLEFPNVVCALET